MYKNLLSTLFSFTGRLSLLHFWRNILILIGCIFVLALVGEVIGTLGTKLGLDFLSGMAIILLPAMAVLYLGLLSFAVRRLHDHGKSAKNLIASISLHILGIFLYVTITRIWPDSEEQGWPIIVVFVFAAYNIYLGVLVSFVPGQPEINRWGAKP